MVLVFLSTPRPLPVSGTPSLGHCEYGILPRGGSQPGLSRLDIFSLAGSPSPKLVSWGRKSGRACFPGPARKGPRLPKVFQEKTSSPATPSSALLQEGEEGLALSFHSSLPRASSPPLPHPDLLGGGGTASASSYLFKNFYLFCQH